MDRLRCHGLGREAGDDVADRFVLHVRDHEFGARLVQLPRQITARRAEPLDRHAQTLEIGPVPDMGGHSLDADEATPVR